MSIFFNLIVRRGNVYNLSKLNYNLNYLNHKNLLFNKSIQQNVIIQCSNYSSKLNSKYQHNLLKIKNEFNQFELNKSIKTTQPNRLPPIFWVIARPILNLVAVVGGRSFRNWWKKLPEDRKQIIRNKLKRNKKIFYALSGFLGLFSVFYYFTHIEETPITKRKRFVAIAKKDYEELSNLQFEAQLKLFHNRLLPVTHPMSKAVERIATRIIRSNLDIKEFKEKNWTTAVIDASNIKNAMVVGDGKIFVFSGMFEVAQNEDALGFVISHEIAHSILSHGAEILSNTFPIDFIVGLGLIFIWSVFPTDLLAGIGHLIVSKLSEIIFHLPYSRKMEVEADKVAMLLAAKACLDIREGAAFWLRMSHLEKQSKSEIDSQAVEFLSTHPTHQSRSEILESMIQESMELRDKLNCPRLPRPDPLIKLKKQIEYEENLKPKNYTTIRIN